jgi:co-chaperonin GroES (HSP10)
MTLQPKKIEPERVIGVADVVKVERFQLIVRQVNTKKVSKGGIILTDETISDQRWTNGMGEVVALGPSVYRGKKFEDMDLHPSDAPKIGEIVLFESRAPRRFKFDGVEHMVIPDDAVWGRVHNREEMHRFAFSIE